LQPTEDLFEVELCIDTHTFTGMVLGGFSSRACPAPQETALIPTFTDGELPLTQNKWSLSLFTL